MATIYGISKWADAVAALAPRRLGDDWTFVSADDHDPTSLTVVRESTDRFSTLDLANLDLDFGHHRRTQS